METNAGTGTVHGVAATVGAKRSRRSDGREGRRLGVINNANAVAMSLFVRALECYLPEKAIAELQALPSPLDHFRHEGASNGRKVGENAYLFEPGCVIDAPWRIWAQRWNIFADCVIPWAWACTLEWHRTGKRPAFPLAVHFGDGSPRAPRATIEAPNPLTESREEAAERTRREWDERAAHIQAVAQATSGSRLRPVERAPRKMAEECKWVVRRRIFKESLETIASSHDGRHRGADIGTISKGIKRIEKLIGLEGFKARTARVKQARPRNSIPARPRTP